MPPETHTSVLLEEAVSALAVQAAGTYVDATFGRGGHSRALLARLGPTGRLIALDRDPQAIAAGQQLVAQEPRLTLLHMPFSQLQTCLATLGLRQVAGILLDLGVSSPQLDTPERGMSFRFDAPLDMRMDPGSGESAADFLARVDQLTLEKVLRDYGEERFAHAIAKALIAARQHRRITTTGQLAALVAQAVPTRTPGKHPATRSFQALRICVNRELEELTCVLPQCLDCLLPGGRLAIISFHSLEDRLVKRFLHTAAQSDSLPRRLPVQASQLPGARLRLLGRAQRPKAAELAANPRARSATLRAAERLPMS